MVCSAKLGHALFLDIYDHITVTIENCRFLSRPELKTEEGYSADIYPWRCMSAQHVTRDICLFREMFCGNCADIAAIVRTYISRDICPHYILLRFSALGNKKGSSIKETLFCPILLP